jgi:glucokinase
MRIAVGDIGGTHARFALAELVAGEPPALGPMHKYRTRDHAGVASAWAQFEHDSGGSLPRAAAIGVAAPIEGEILRFVNSNWEIGRHTLAGDIGVDRLLLLNDFGAVAHAVAALPAAALAPLCGPAAGLPREGVTSVIGPGTGLGVSTLIRRGAQLTVVETESAHIAFAPQTEEETALERAVRARYGRCSVERIVSGPGLLEIVEHLGGGTRDPLQAGSVWESALDGSDAIAASALDLLVGCFGASAGDISLAHGSMSVVITGGLAARMRERLRSPLFHRRFGDKGRYRPRMERIPVLLCKAPEPGLFGAAVAFQRAFLSGSGEPEPAG